MQSWTEIKISCNKDILNNLKLVASCKDLEVMV